MSFRAWCNCTRGCPWFFWVQRYRRGTCPLSETLSCSKKWRCRFSKRGKVRFLSFISFWRADRLLYQGTVIWTTLFYLLSKVLHSQESSSLTISGVNGWKTFCCAWRGFWRRWNSTPIWRSTLWFLAGTSTDMVTSAGPLSAWVTCLVLVVHAARKWKPLGLRPIPLGLAFTRWVLVHGTRLLMTTGVGLIFRKSLAFVSNFIHFRISLIRA